MNKTNISQIVGYVGGVLVVSLNAPLLYTTIKEKSTDKLSIASLFLHLITSITYITYGILIEQYPVILCNLAYTLMTCSLLIVKLYYDRNKNKIQSNVNIP